MKNIHAKKLCAGVMVGCLLSVTAQAQNCKIAPTCQELGFNKTAADCVGISSLKCPLDENYMFCPGNGWVFDFIGNGDPQVGSIIYSDGTINTALFQDKTPIAIVFDVKNRLAVGLWSIEDAWMEKSNGRLLDVPANPNFSIENAKEDMDGRKNTLTISEFCKARRLSCPAVEVALSYAAGKWSCDNGSTGLIQGQYTSGISGITWDGHCELEGAGLGQWFLPSSGQLITLMEKRNILNPILVSVAPYSHELFFSSSNKYWTSTEVLSSSGDILESQAHCIDYTLSLKSSEFLGGPEGCNKGGSAVVRPIMHFELKQQ